MNSDDVLLVLGDFNLPNIKYSFNDGNKLIPSNFKPGFTAKFSDEITAKGHRQLNYFSSETSNVLDLIFLNDELEHEIKKCDEKKCNRKY